ncbi:fragmin60 [Coprinopsis marcescibilis]|uniref:Fragmin60 n=1 Tax=Coprinopsis marcescibilis TaxID=230819 RepID=A0A5C3L7Z9_COPMA|nr:fragmin60 [Coprinopsis marcescibilis]
MAYLTKPTVYNIEDSNIALLGSDVEKRVRENAGDAEPAWETAGQDAGLKIWRIEQFHIADWAEDRYGSFYAGDSYIVLYTYKSSPEAKDLSFNLHFWLGANTTVDEAGTAAYKTVELDDHLHGKPVQFREVQGYESPQFLSYFQRFTCLDGGVATGFRKVVDPPPLDVRKLYRITLSRLPSRIGEAGKSKSTLVVREVPAEAASLVAGDTYVLDRGEEVWQLNTTESAGQERYKAAEFVQSLIAERKGQCQLKVFDEGHSGVSGFLGEFGEGTTLLPSPLANQQTQPIKIFKVSDASGKLEFTPLQGPVGSLLSSSDAFLIDDTHNLARPALYAWIGKQASLAERRSVIQYAQNYLYRERDSHVGLLGVPIIKMDEGRESRDFTDILSAS